ncbi:MspA family porin [Nocardia huaxiensis]|uniref:MspA family porin n=1 Tax=Nocardia huaxiensis TaxID=2755382 RepID=A0A7D6ZTK7_9NOCA|nr:MspA family porin [Nocardia huaxiensis]QLY28329.1 MspA family porin [Nocardia huaxiensis]UFS98230.1 MspA family porin [Nocardia huaxiensis]
MSIRDIAARIAGAGLATTAALGLLSTGAANADTFIPLPGGELTQTLSDGTVVTVRLVGESATLSGSMGATPLHRNAWVSASAQVTLSGPNAEGGKIYPGYVVGCQVAINGGGVSGGVSGKTDWEGKKPEIGGTAGGNLSLGPGQAGAMYLLDLEEADDYGKESHQVRNKFKGTSGSVTWADSTIGVNGCAGYAQARAFVRVKVSTATVNSVVTLWGQPFSLG